MIEIKVNEIINWFHNNYKDELVKSYIIKEKNITECFRKIYIMRRSGRYDNARKYNFEDPSMEEKYQQWKTKNETIEMFYGNATVD